MYSIAHEDFDPEELPTLRDALPAVFVASVDKARIRLEDAIATLESGGNPDAVLEDLKAAHALVNGRGSP